MHANYFHTHKEKLAIETDMTRQKIQPCLLFWFPVALIKGYFSVYKLHEAQRKVCKDGRGGS